MQDFPALHLFIHFYTTRQATALHRLSKASTHYNCAQSNSLRLCWGWQAHSHAAVPKSHPLLASTSQQ